MRFSGRHVWLLVILVLTSRWQAVDSVRGADTAIAQKQDIVTPPAPVAPGRSAVISHRWGIWEAEVRRLSEQDVVQMRRDYGLGLFFYRSASPAELATYKRLGLVNIVVAHALYDPWKNHDFLKDTDAVRAWVRSAVLRPEVDGLAYDCESRIERVHALRVLQAMADEVRRAGKLFITCPHFNIGDERFALGPSDYNRHSDMVMPWCYNRYGQPSYREGILELVRRWREAIPDRSINPIIDCEKYRQASESVEVVHAVAAGTDRVKAVACVTVFAPHVSWAKLHLDSQVRLFYEALRDRYGLRDSPQGVHTVGQEAGGEMRPGQRATIAEPESPPGAPTAGKPPAREDGRPKFNDYVDRKVFPDGYGILTSEHLMYPANVADWPVRIDANRQLFIDDYLVASIQQLTREFHQPVKHPANPLIRTDRPWEHPHIWLGFVLHNRGQKRFRMWYNGGKERVLYAESQDGIAWSKPELGLIENSGSRQNNIIIEGGYTIGLIEGMRGPRGDEGFRAIVWHRPPSAPETGYYLYRSPDGVRWTREREHPVITSTYNASLYNTVGAGDTSIVRYDTLLRRYVWEPRPTSTCRWRP